MIGGGICCMYLHFSRGQPQSCRFSFTLEIVKRQPSHVLSVSSSFPATPVASSITSSTGLVSPHPIPPSVTASTTLVTQCFTPSENLENASGMAKHPWCGYTTTSSGTTLHGTRQFPTRTQCGLALQRLFWSWMVSPRVTWIPRHLLIVSTSAPN